MKFKANPNLVIAFRYLLTAAFLFCDVAIVVTGVMVGNWLILRLTEPGSLIRIGGNVLLIVCALKWSLKALLNFLDSWKLL